ncbi:cytochrome P450 [Serendipita vermifera]|nr:cytochrome P450 [Serendipita vermifera]
MNHGDYYSERYIGMAIGIVATTAMVRAFLNTPAAKARRAGATLPPGPKQEFLIGNLRNFPKQGWPQVFTNWKEEYGDIVYVNMPGQPIIILNSLEAVTALAERRMNIYSARPYSFMSNKLMHLDEGMVLMPPNQSHSEQRKILNKAMGPLVVKQYDALIEDHAAHLVEALAGFVGDPFPLIVKSVGSFIVRSSYGEKIYKEHGDELVATNKRRSEITTWVRGRFWMVDIFPFLRFIPAWFPGAKFRRIGLEGERLMKKIRYDAFNLVEADLAKGIVDESIVTRYINEPGVDKNELRDAVSVLYSAGFTTTSVSILNFLYALLIHQDVQSRVHEELDECVGTGRLPSLAAIETLPYFNAAWRESMRWRPPTPIGVPHATSEADIWKGYYIPKDSIVYCNLGCIQRDPTLWGEDADVYNPNRFLADVNPQFKELPELFSTVFGFGKRICPGRHLAERVVLTFSAAILSKYKIVPLEGDTGIRDFRDGSVSWPSNFQCKLIPRH